MDRDLINCAYIMEPQLKTLNHGVQRAFQNTWRYWEGEMEGLVAPNSKVHPTHLALCISSDWLFLSCILKLISLRKVFPWVLWAIMANYQTRKGEWREPSLNLQLIGQKCRKPVLMIGIWRGAVLWNWALNPWGPRQLWVVSALLCRKPSCCPESWKLIGVGKPPTHLVSDVPWVENLFSFNDHP